MITSHWTPHQRLLAEEWLATLNVADKTETATVVRTGLSVMRISLWVALAALALGALIWWATP